MSRSHFGTVRKLPSGKFQARYTDPHDVRRTAGSYPTIKEARDALAAVQADIATLGDAWLPLGVDPQLDQSLKLHKFLKGQGEDHKIQKSAQGSRMFRTFAGEYLKSRSDLKPRTVENYETLLNKWLLPEFDKPLTQITVKRVDDWWSAMGTMTGKVNRRNAYFLLKGIMKRAHKYGHIEASPCVVELAGKAVSKPRPYLSLEEFEKIVQAAPDSLTAPLWVMFGAHLRLGELCGLNVGDVNLATKEISVTRQSQVIRGGTVLSETKTGNHRTIVMLQPAVDALTAHLEGNEDPASAPLFRGVKGGRLSRGYVDAHWRQAREAVGLPHAHLHDIRHTSLTLVAAHATTRETMMRGGHTSVAAAMKYQHATASRDLEVAQAVDAAMKKQP